MIRILYLVTFLLSVVMCVRFLVRNKKADSTFISFAFLIMINNLGRYLLATSETTEMALWANKFMYVGGCFVPYMLALLMANLCNIKIPDWLKCVGAIPSAVVYGFVITIGKSDIYYKNAELAFGDGYSYLKKEYGPMHNLYPILMVTFCVLYVVIIMYAIIKRNRISVLTLSITGGMGLFTIGTYIVQRVLHSTIEWISVSYLVCIIIMTMLYERINMFDMSANIANSVERMHEYGYIVFDKQHRFINANNYAEELFPEIREWKPDAVPTTESGSQCNEILQYCLEKQKEGLSNTRNKTISLGEHWFELVVRDIAYTNKKVGYLLEIVDRTAEKQYMSAIESYNQKLEKEVEEKTANIVYVKDMMVLGMSSMVESRDSSTGGHIKRTSKVVELFSDRLMKYEDTLGMTRDFLKLVAKAAPMHDLGKIAVDDRILRKQGRFTDEEFNEMKKHATAGGEIVDSILNGVEDEEFVKIARNVAYYHHEKYDGNGYPFGLKGENIPIEARIMALADVFDALVSKRCYKEAYSYDKAFSIIKDSIGTHFDPKLGDVFLKCRPELETLYNSFG